MEGSQFRCAGSVKYVEWIESVLAGQDAGSNRRLAREWYSSAASAKVGKPTLDFRIFDNPETWEGELRTRRQEGNSLRLLSTYSRSWKSEKASSPHKLDPKLMDFHEPYIVSGETKYWSRIWNFVPSQGSDYTWFVVGHPAGFIATDPFCEVGCPYAVRGFDYDYVGILWLDDLAWRNGRLNVSPTAVEERGIKDLTSKARREHNKGPRTAELLQRVSQAYRILFTRALKGVYVWIPDDATRAHLIASLP